MDEIEELIQAFMMHFIVRVMAEYASSQRIRDVRAVPNSTLQGNAKCMVDGNAE